MASVVASMNFKVSTDDSQFLTEMNKVSPSKLVIVDFTSARCPPCLQISPLFQRLADKYKNAIFFKVDISNCPIAAQTYSVTATPTFLFFKNKVKIDSLKGANINALEEKIIKLYGDADDSQNDLDDCGVPGHMDLISMITKKGCECLNESDDHIFSHALTSGSGYLESDVDEQLIMYLEFNQSVKIHSLRIKGPTDLGPKTIKLFINQPYTLDFDSAETGAPVQEMTLTAKQLDGDLISLKYVRFQSVMNLAIFVKDNQSGDEITKVSYLQVIGSPLQTTNMGDFKRIAGKKGESH